MMKKLTCIFFAIFSIQASFAQTGWEELGTLNGNDAVEQLWVDGNGTLYVTGAFTNIANRMYVAKWTGTTWAELGGVNSLQANNYIFDMMTDSDNNLYVAGGFSNSSTGAPVVKWNGTAWSAVGTTYTLLIGFKYAIYVDAAKNIYVGGHLGDGTGGSGYAVIKWDGTSWAPLGGTGSSGLNASSFIVDITGDASGNIYVAGYFKNASNYMYIAKWDGSSWSELGTGLNANGTLLEVHVDYLGNIYTAGQCKNSNLKYYVAKWDGTSWSEVGTGANALNANGQIIVIDSDNQGNLYVGGSFKNAAGKRYVAKWDGTTWAEMGSGTGLLNANNDIWAITHDADNIYAGGMCTNASAKYPVYKCSRSALTTALQNGSIEHNEIQVYPNPSSDVVFISLQEAQVGESYSVYNAHATKVLSGVVNESSFPLMIENLAPGMYMFQLDAYADRSVKIIKR